MFPFLQEYEEEENYSVEDQKQFIKALTLLRVKEIKMLLNRGVSPNFQDEHGRTPLHMIANMYTEQGTGLFLTGNKLKYVFTKTNELLLIILTIVVKKLFLYD